MMAMQSLKKLLGFKSIDKPSWWHKESRKFMFYLPGQLPFFLSFFGLADSAVNLIRCSCGRCLSGVFGRLIEWLFLREGGKFHIVCCVYARGGGIPESLMSLGRCQARQAMSACLVRCRPLTLLVSYVVSVQGSSDQG